MIRVALRGLAGRKLRALLTGIAIVLGVAMISGTYVLTDTIDRAFKTLFTESLSGTDAVVSGRGLDISIDGEAPPSPPVDDSLAEMMESDDPPMVVDVRTRSQHDRDPVKIPGSVRVLPDSVPEWASDQLKDRPYVLYCA